MKTALLVFFIVIISCNNSINNKECKDKLQQVLKIPISDSFKIVDFKTSSSIGDYYESFGIRFSKEEFNYIFEKIKPDRTISDTSLYYIEKRDKNDFTSLTFEINTNTIYYNYIDE